MRRALGPILLILVVALGVRLEARRTAAVFTDSGVLFIDPDDYMRLYRAREILEGRAGRIDRMPEINWPLGGRLHWTLPMDYLLVAATKIVGPLAGGSPQEQLDRVAAWLPVAIGGLYLALLMQSLARACGWPPAILVGLLVAVSPPFHRAFALGHPDHHCLLELLFLLAVMRWLPARRADGRGGIPSRGAALGSGLCMGLALWVAPQAMAVWLAILVGATFATYHASPLARAVWTLRRFEWNCGVFFMAAAGYLAENWPNLSAAAIDRISVFHVALTLVALMVPSGVASAPTGAALGVRLRAVRSWLWLAAGLAMMAIWLAFQHDDVFETVARPEFYRWSEHIVELQPLWTRTGDAFSPAQMHAWLGFLPYGLVVALPFFARNKQIPCGTKLTLILLAVGFTALAICQRRWLDHAGLGLMIVVGVGFWEFVGRLLTRAGADKLIAQTAICAVISVALAGPGVVTTWERSNAGPHPLDLRTAIVAGRLVEYEQSQPATADDRRAILCDDSEGSMLLYRTRLPIVAAPYHRTIDGIVEAARFYAERNEALAGEQLDRLGVRYVIVPYRAHEQLMNFERIAFDELRSYDPPIESIDAHGLLRLELRYRPEIARTMAYRLAMQPGAPPAGLECIAVIREGAQTTDGYSGLVYKVVPPPRPESEF